MTYEKCLIPVKARSITHKTGDIKVLGIIKMYGTQEGTC